MPLHIPIAGVQIATYEVEGTTSTVTSPLNDVEELIPDMTIDILGVKASDVFWISFDCSLNPSSKYTTPARTKFRVRVNGVQVGRRQQATIRDVAAPFRMPLAMTRVYTLPSDGDYTVTATWQNEGTMVCELNIIEGIRQLSVAHIKS